MNAQARYLLALLSTLVSFVVCPARAATVDAIYSAASDIPVTASGYTATGNTVNLTLSFTPPTGTTLTVVNNTSLDFISASPARGSVRWPQVTPPGRRCP